MQVEFSPRSRRDLLAIGEWIEKDDPRTAERIVEQLIAACEQLGDRADTLSFQATAGCESGYGRLT